MDNSFTKEIYKEDAQIIIDALIKIKHIYSLVKDRDITDEEQQEFNNARNIITTISNSHKYTVALPDEWTYEDFGICELIVFRYDEKLKEMKQLGIIRI